MTDTFINIADLRDPNDPQGRSYRQINTVKTHSIPIGSLVEIEDTGVRMYIVAHDRDCDMTPLYYLSPYRDDTVREREGFRNTRWIGGYPESALTVVEPGKATREANDNSDRIGS